MVSFFEGLEDRHIFVSVLAAVEVRSAIRRRQRSGDILEQDADLAIATLAQETSRLVECPITSVVLAQAANLLDRHGLRALDALQLANAILQREVSGNDMFTFVASDLRLLEAAQRDGFQVWDPSLAS